MASTKAPISALASASTPHSNTSPSTGSSSACSCSAETVWNPATRRAPEGSNAFACSAAEPAHGVITSQARPPTAVARGVVVSHTNAAGRRADLIER